MNRVIRNWDLDAIYVMGPGHGGPAAVANAYLEGTYTEVYPDITHDEDGLRKLFRQFSFPGGIPSHVAPETPGSIHEGGELGYALSHAYGAAFDNPDLLVCCIVGDGEAETGPLATGWHSNKFLEPGRRRRRAADPAPERLQDRQPDRARPDRRRRADVAARGLRAHGALGRRRRARRRCTSGWRPSLDEVVEEIGAIQRAARARRRDGAAALADDRPADAEGLDGPEGRSTACRPRARGARTRCRSRRCARTRSTSPSSRRWLRSYRPGGAVRRERRARRRARRRCRRRATGG